MSLLDNASLLLTPNAYKASKLYSVIPSNGNGDFTATRATTATRINSSGLVESVALNVPRVDYSLGGCPNILLEPQRTNLALQSEDLTNGWSIEGLTVTANQTTAPSGNTTADTIQENAVTDVHRIYRTGITTVASTNYAFSFYVKKDTQRYVRLILNQTTNAAIWAAAQFDLDNQTYTSGVGSGGGTFVSASISPAANGFYRITLVATVTSTITFAFLSLSDGTAISSADSRGCNTYLGNTSNRIWGWGAQLEAGAYATSYIPTTTASVTRNLDVVQDLGVSSLIGQTEGTIYWEGTLTSGQTDDIFCLNRSVTNSVFLYKSTTNNIILRVYYGGATFTISNATAYTGLVKIAAAYKSGSSVMYINGVQAGTSATAFTFTGALNDVVLNNTTFLVGNATKSVKELALFPTRLTNAQCLALTA